MDNNSLTEPLLSTTEESSQTREEHNFNSQSADADETTSSSPPQSCHAPSSDDNGNDNNDNNSSSSFSIYQESLEMIHLALPLAVSFFCRMGMASTDSAFVGHLNTPEYTAEIYLAAAVLSDMVIGVLITPPLAFNQVLNGLVSQAMGSGNPKMAGVWLQQSMGFLSLSMLPCLTGLWYVEPILLKLGFPHDVSHIAGVYAKYNILWPIPNGLYQCLRFYFQAQGLATPAMVNNVLFLGINALLNWIFVFGAGGIFGGWTGFGFIGAAISLSISRTMQGVVYFIYMFLYKKHHIPTWPDNGWSFQHHTKDRILEFLKQSVPNIGTLLFQSAASQATTVLVGRLGELSIAASSALSTVTIPWSGTLSATCGTVSGVRVGFHLGRGHAQAARTAAWMVLAFVTIATLLLAVAVVSFQKQILSLSTSDHDVLGLAATLVPAMLVGTYLNLVVGIVTSGVFSGMGRPLIATILSFGLELPLSIGGVALYVLLVKGSNLLGVYWWQAITGGIEVVLVLAILMRSNWNQCAEEAQARQESSSAASRQNHRHHDTTSDDNHDPELAVGLLTAEAEGSSSDEPTQPEA